MISIFLKDNKISLTDAAKRLQISRVTLSNIVNGKSTLTPKIAQRFEEVYGLSKERLLEEQAHSFGKKMTGIQITKRCQSNPILPILSTDIDRWANENSSRFTFAQLIRILILSTSTNVVFTDFPANNEAERPSFDGELTCEETHPWIPKGDSYWELGTNKDCKKKASSDLENSLKKLERDQRKKSTFVFVTPCSWKNNAKWIQENKKKNYWKDIRVIDASILEQWIECSLEAQVWLSKELKKDTEGIETLSMCWERWISPLRGTHFPKSLFNELTDEFSEKVLAFLKNENTRFLSISADSKEEAYVFLYLTLENLPLEEKNLYHQVLVFNSAESVKSIPRHNNNIIAIASDKETKRELLEHPYSRFIWIERTRRVDKRCEVELHPISSAFLNKTCEDEGISYSEARKWEKASSGSLTALYRFLAKDSCFSPSWSEERKTLASLIPFLFAGAWENTEKEPDWKIVKALSRFNASEGSSEENFQNILALSDSPLWQEATACGVKSKRDLYLMIKTSITRSDYERFFHVLRSVLTTPPEPSDNQAILSSPSKGVSGLLRKNLVDTLVLLARDSNPIQTCPPFNFKREAEKAATDILNTWDESYFYNYDDCLEPLALAAPDAFLSYFENHQDICEEILKPVTNVFSCRTPRPAFLAALHNLCWEKETFERAVSLLTHLATKEVKDAIGDLPSGRLDGIFSSFLVQSGVTTQTRINLLRDLAPKFPNVFFDICIDDLFTPPLLPRWNPPPTDIRLESFSYRTTKEDANAMLQVKTDLIFSGIFPWTDENVFKLFNIFERVPSEKREAIITIAKNWSKGANLKAKQRLALHIERRIEFSLKKSGGLSAEIEKLKELCQTLSPESEEEKLLSLFSPETFHRFYLETKSSNAVFKLLEKEKKTALRNWKDAYGVDGIAQLILRADVNFIQEIAGLCSELLPNTKLTKLILKVREEGADKTRLRKILIGSLFLPNEKVLLSLRNKLKDDELLNLLYLIPPNCITARFVREYLPKSEIDYWKNVEVSSLLCEKADDGIAVAEKLCSIGRTDDAFLFTWPVHGSMPVGLLRNMLEKIEFSLEKNNPLANASYEIQKALEIVCASPEIPQIDKALLEIKFSPLLVPTGMFNEPPLRNLTNYVLQEPGFLVSLIEYVSRKERSIEESTGENRKISTIWHMLNVINLDHQSSGVEPKINYLQWAKKMMMVASERGVRSNVEHHLGEILGRHNRERFQNDSTKERSWFNRDYCEIIETFGTPTLLKGFYTGVFNSIGPHTQTLNGNTEKRFAKIFEEDAKEAQDFPKVQRVFLDLQQEFEGYAQNEDENLMKMQRTRYIF